jgi:nitrogen fixation/metabolism regulation signal transduction histidine kinase
VGAAWEEDLVRPIANLTEVSEQLASGDLPLQLDLTRIGGLPRVALIHGSR